MKDRSKRIVKAVSVLCEAFQVKPTGDTFAAFEMGLAKIPVETVESAVAAAIVGMKWMPKVSELLLLCGVTEYLVTAEDRATVAWGAVKKAIATHGTYRSVQFDDPLATATIRLLGGWARFGEVKSGKDFDVWLKKDFIEAYETLSRTGVNAEMTGPLFGCDPSMTDKRGFLVDQVATIPVGLPPIDKKLIRGVIRDAKETLRLSDETRQFVDSLGVPELEEKPKPDKKEIAPEDVPSKATILEELRAKQAALANRPLVLVEEISDPKAKPFRKGVTSAEEKVSRS